MKQILLFSILASSLLFFSCGAKEGADAVTEKTTSGYAYVHHVKNDGNKPAEGDEVTYQTAIYKNDSLLFSSFENPVPQRVIIPSLEQFQGASPPPDFEGIMLMSPGDSITMYQPLDTFSQLPPGYSNSDEIIYQIKLLSVKNKAQRMEEELAIKGQESAIGEKTTQTVEDYIGGKLKGQLKETESGLKYIIHEEGAGEQAEAGDIVTVNYYGSLTDGTMFDNSFKTGGSFEFPLGAGRVIQGWDEGIALLKEGTKATFFIPYQLGYGEAGSPPVIPEKAELVFYVELVETVKG